MINDEKDDEQDITAQAPQVQQQQSILNVASQLTSLWGMTPGSLQEAKREVSRVRVSHGMLAGVPIICRDADCPYVKVCTISPQNRVIGQRCPMEIGAIIARFEDYCSHFGIDIHAVNPQKEDIVDLSLIRDLVEIEIQLLRAENRIAISGDFIVKVVGAVDSRGKAYYEDAVSQESEYKIKLLDKKWKVLQLLDSTRRDKSKHMAKANDPSTKAASIFSKISGMINNAQPEDIVTVDVTTPHDVDFKDEFIADSSRVFYEEDEE